MSDSCGCVSYAAAQFAMCWPSSHSRGTCRPDLLCASLLCGFGYSLHTSTCGHRICKQPFFCLLHQMQCPWRSLFAQKQLKQRWIKREEKGRGHVSPYECCWYDFANFPLIWILWHRDRNWIAALGNDLLPHDPSSLWCILKFCHIQDTSKHAGYCYPILWP